MAMNHVVAAALVDDLRRPTRVLAARRTAPAQLAGRWEFPGGKVEVGEEPVAALHREIAEELGVVIEVGAALPGPESGAWPLPGQWRMSLWWALPAGEPQPLQDHDRLRWLGPESLDSVPWLESNRAVLAAVERAMAASTPAG